MVAPIIGRSPRTRQKKALRLDDRRELARTWVARVDEGKITRLANPDFG